MEKSWFIIQHGNKTGPIPWKDLTILAKEGKINPNDMILLEGDKKWVSAATIPNLLNFDPENQVDDIEPVRALPVQNKHISNLDVTKTKINQKRRKKPKVILKEISYIPQSKTSCWIIFVEIIRILLWIVCGIGILSTLGSYSQVVHGRIFPITAEQQSGTAGEHILYILGWMFICFCIDRFFCILRDLSR